MRVVSPKRRTTRHDESAAVARLSFDRFREIAEAVESEYRELTHDSMWITGYDFVASEVRPKSFDSSIALLFSGVAGNETEIQVPFRTVAAVDAMPERDRMGSTVGYLTLLVMEELTGCSVEELGPVSVIEFDLN